jgi:hypothetical protein
MQELRNDRLSGRRFETIFRPRAGKPPPKSGFRMRQAHEGVTMKLELNAPGIVLRKNQVLALDEAQGARLYSEDGIVWVTQDGDLRDIVLKPGESVVLDRDTPTLVQAVTPARVRIGEPAPRAHGLAALAARLRTAVGVHAPVAA